MVSVLPCSIMRYLGSSPQYYQSDLQTDSVDHMFLTQKVLSSSLCDLFSSGSTI